MAEWGVVCVPQTKKTISSNWSKDVFTLTSLYNRINQRLYSLTLLHHCASFAPLTKFPAETLLLFPQMQIWTVWRLNVLSREPQEGLLCWENHYSFTQSRDLNWKQPLNNFNKLLIQRSLLLLSPDTSNTLISLWISGSSEALVFWHFAYFVLSNEEKWENVLY